MSTGSILVPAESLREQVERMIAARIVSGETPPGDVLTVPTLAGDFGVSATPVREAMLNLARRGFLRPIRNRGFQVTEVSADELQQLTEVRLLLEAPPMRRVAGAIEAALEKELRELADRIVAAARSRRFEEYLEADTAFHLRVLAVTGNQKLVDTVRELRQQTRLVGLVRLADADALVPTALEHAELVDLLAAGDGEGAEALMRRHLGHVGGVWSGREEH
ncbi:MAG: GntR family transcriptional regulator [Microbacterium sp.]|jgi:DNA-binding GntR family transcriptional regulator|uniref:GntR family transcriptional regulator n=1 Tax=Microbacterium sp. TaxID=51671 RepID=UPI002825A21E|nr:GntR family transcriptional regulator [Microbacterium sp.]MDR2323611.1 GntR family transcriptional regulator [Microbacterium sp.]